MMPETRPNIASEILPSTLHELLEELYTLRRFHASAGLHRIESLLSALDNPQKRFPSVHIAGTNGKGTVSSLIASVLTEAGYKVGLYTSPHILRFNERIRINGAEVSDEELLALVRRIMPLVMQENGTFFEAATALAFQYFADNDVDIAVIETGLGGRLDATNVLTAENVLLTAITSIDYDHIEYLGDTLPQIASEKAGIMKQGVPCIVAEPRGELRATFNDHAKRTNARLSFLDDDCAVKVEECSQNFTMRLQITTPQYVRNSVESRLCGTHQARNILTAAACLENIQVQFPSTETDFLSGLQNIHRNSGLRGRIELLRSAPPLVMDVAHNPAGMAMLIQTLQQCGYAGVRWNVVFGAMQDKHLEAMLKTLAPICACLHLPNLDFSRARTAQDIAQAAENLGIETREYASVAEACENVTPKAAPMLVAGSFHLAEEVLQWWNKG
ncbi:MAG: bifunctional folylpolyglutamate synthase/dihydrofolate synthase [Candidatus Kapabacteria bacterium]|jgi:dihydrofolate synthase/folylpolyglutamate synthase|nr:bifunctional folylpolyglutamate synthase/dihydrofolate synthase [Candidatus Kapabacteria bacterium]